jgi:signal transduction histidine kinase
VDSTMSQNHLVPAVEPDVREDRMAEPLDDTRSRSHSEPASRQVPALTTHFAPAGRDAACEIRRKARIIESVPLLSEALDAIPGMVMILNRNRQIIFANQRLLAILNVSLAEVVEERPGEAVKCIRAVEGPDGCGTGVHCTTCGAVRALMESTDENTEAAKECRILVQTPSGVVPLDLRVTATPFEAEDEYFILAAIEDISHEKRVAVLQRTFFHDVLNTAGCIGGYADFLVEDATSDPEVCKRLQVLSGQLVDEIQSQRDMLHAEQGSLRAQQMPVKASQALEELRAQYLNHAVTEERKIAIGETWDGLLITDRRLLKRVLGNMLKNALEATPPLGTVIISCEDSGDAVTFLVNNSTVMPRDVQLQVFQRSFSTKRETGRGIGTYSMKLFGERYLRGEVDFVSRESEGTTFRLQLPKKPCMET